MYQLVKKSVVPLDTCFAVKGEERKGIFRSQVEAMVTARKDPTAEVKEFPDRASACLWIYGKVLIHVGKEIVPLPKIYAYTCGEWNNDSGYYGFGGMLVCGDKKFKVQGSGCDQDLFRTRRGAGEVIGAKCLLHYADALELPELTICHNHHGIRSWATGKRKHRCEETEDYQQYFENVSKKMKITFYRVINCNGLPERNRSALAAYQCALKGTLCGDAIYETEQFLNLSPDLVREEVAKIQEERRKEEEKENKIFKNPNQEEMKTDEDAK